MPAGTNDNPALARQLLDDIDAAGDPLTAVRADVDLLSDRRRRAARGDGRR